MTAPCAYAGADRFFGGVLSVDRRRLDGKYRWKHIDRMKQQRHSAIRELLNQATVTSQDELRRRLARRGFHVTQATLSRDIHELRLSKGPAGYALPGIA